MDSILIYKKTMEYSRPKFYAKASLSCQVLYCKHYISMYLDEYLTKKFGFLRKIIWSQKMPPSPKPSGPGINMQYFSNIFILIGALNVEIPFKHKNAVVNCTLS